LNTRQERRNILAMLIQFLSFSKIKLVILLNLFVLASCNTKLKETNEKIHVTVKVIDYHTKLPRINDSIIVRAIVPSIPMRRYVDTACAVTDIRGEARFEINKKGGYVFHSEGSDRFCGNMEYESGVLKNNDAVVIEVVKCDGIKRILESKQ
jgi:hypothetical protein